jgi:hypothetical protein
MQADLNADLIFLLNLQVAAALALGAAGVAAGSWFLSRYMSKSQRRAHDEEPSQAEKSEEQAQNRKDLRRKRTDVQGRCGLQN